MLNLSCCFITVEIIIWKRPNVKEIISIAFIATETPERLDHTFTDMTELATGAHHSLGITHETATASLAIKILGSALIRATVVSRITTKGYMIQYADDIVPPLLSVVAIDLVITNLPFSDCLTS